MAQSSSESGNIVDDGRPLSSSSQADSRHITAPAPARGSLQPQTNAAFARQVSEGASFGSDYIPFVDNISSPNVSTVSEAVDDMDQWPTLPSPSPPALRRWSGLRSGFGSHALTPGPPPDAPTGPRSMQVFQPPRLLARPIAHSPPQELGQNSLIVPQFGVYEGKRKGAHLTSRSTSPPRVRIKLDGQTTGRITEDNSPHTTPAAAHRQKTTSVLVVDPRDKKTSWRILCLTQNLMRRKICGYLGFSNTSQMRDWEESDPARWTYIQNLTSTPPGKVPNKITVLDVLRIVCNDGGVMAHTLAYMEGLEPWAAFLSSEDPSLHRVDIALLSELGGHSAVATFLVTMAIVWLICESPAQFLESGRFNASPHFWYAPEDVNRAFWYFNNLRYHPNERKNESMKPAKQVKRGVSVGQESLHNSQSEGQWAGRFLRKDLLAKLEQAADKQGDQIKTQLLHLRKWAYKTYPSFNTTDESQLDDLMNITHGYIKTQDRDMDGFNEACIDVELYVLGNAHPRIMNDAAKDLLADFMVLLRWLHRHSATIGEDEGVGGLMRDAVVAVAAVDKETFIKKYALIKEMVYNAELQNQ